MSSKLWIGNMAPNTTDETLREFLAKYAHGLEVVDIKRIEGDGTRPAAIVRFKGGTLESVPNLALRLDGMYWQGKKLSCAAQPGLVDP